MSFEEMMNAFLDHLRGLRRVKATQNNFRKAASEFIRYCIDVHDCASPHDVRETYLGGYAADQERRKLSRLTIYARHRTVRTWFAWAHLRGHLLADPLKNVHMVSESDLAVRRTGTLAGRRPATMLRLLLVVAPLGAPAP